MYKVKKEYIGKEVRHFLAKPFEGKNSIFLESASQEELEHLYNEVGLEKFIEKEEKKKQTRKKY